MKDKTTISYTLTDTLAVGIPTAIMCSIFIPVIFLANWEWWIDLILALTCLGMIYSTIDSYFTDFTITFDKEGFSLNERNRVNSSEKVTTYKWADIREIYFKHLGGRYRTPVMTITYKKGEVENLEFSRILASYKKFVYLSRYYSGREGIIRESGRKRKPFKKDY